MKFRKLQTILAVSAVMLLAFSALAFAGCGQGSSASSSAASSGAASSSAEASSNASSESASSEAASNSATDKRHAQLTVEGYDPITIELDPEAAPLTVENFCELAEGGYYDGLTFYRFVEGFCMQGGTKGNSAQGHDSSLTPIPGEFSLNGYDNSLADNFQKGTVAMGRTSDPNSATSTFFVTLDTSKNVSLSLNGQYAAFGTIDEAGMAIVDQIVADYLPNVTDSRTGVIADEANQPKISSIKILD